MKTLVELEEIKTVGVAARALSGANQSKSDVMATHTCTDFMELTPL